MNRNGNNLYLRQWVADWDNTEIGTTGTDIIPFKWQEPVDVLYFANLVTNPHAFSRYTGRLVKNDAGDHQRVFEADVLRNSYNNVNHLVVYSQERLAWLLLPMIADLDPAIEDGAPLLSEALLSPLLTHAGDVFTNPKLAPANYIKTWFPYAISYKRTL